MTTAFEHRIVRFELGWAGFDYAGIERRLSDLGAEGWEAVSTLQPSIGAAATEIVVLLKRTR
ncbi:MAG: hypothetical protein NTW05_11695 [Pseudonocardiales bacterium]|jgi:hypothetical protein|nr:hypothetical protein [Pseudonocardiales bacterium]